VAHGHLRIAFESPDPDIAGQTDRATAKTTYPVWTMNAIGDQMFHNASGPMPRWYRPVGADHRTRSAAQHAVLARRARKRAESRRQRNDYFISARSRSGSR
jgi:hypothetical protein